MLVTIYCIIGLIVFVLNLIAIPEILKELPVVSNALIVFSFIISFFAGVLWPITIVYGIYKEANRN